MTEPTDLITVSVDPTNPGQFFACCGLLELADRLWPGAEGWFAEGGREFHIACDGTLTGIADALRTTGVVGALTPALQQEREGLELEKRRLKKLRQKLPGALEKRRKELGNLFRAGSLKLPTPFDLLLDWWRSDDESIPKTWAGSQAVIRIALAAHDGCVRLLTHELPFQEYRVMRPAVASADDEVEEEESGDKVEPFYFDAQRGSNALARDIGFVPDALQIETHASPVVEFLTLV
ncbi:MAG: type I-G CRISPR-associated protein Cas8g2, partial [Armatimonadaceae bacterium]